MQGHRRQVGSQLDRHLPQSELDQVGWVGTSQGLEALRYRVLGEGFPLDPRILRYCCQFGPVAAQLPIQVG